MITLCCFLMAAAGQTTDPDSMQLKTFREEFVRVAPGEDGFPRSFEMGRAEGGSPQERPVRRVTLAYPFEVAKYEVTQRLWEAVMGNNPSRWSGPRNSVEMLSFDDAQEFCRRVTQLLREAKLITADQLVRLPSEAEWEYVTRAGTTTVYSFGDDPQPIDGYAWHTGNAAGNDPPVGAKRPNPWGLYDVHGYLWEWCADAAHPNYQQAPVDGTAWASDGAKEAAVKMGVLRGGSWKDPAEVLTSSYRRFAPRSLKDDAVGLRVVLATRASESPPGTP